jgi:cyclophilin family peptidyl-prolyl cis-trans isomerase
MANAGKDTNGSQFFINEVDNAYLDGQFTVFGACADLGTVKAIAKVPADAANKPRSPVSITHVTISHAK